METSANLDPLIASAAAQAAAPLVNRGRRRSWARKFCSQTGAVVALGWVLLMVLVAIFASLVAPHAPSVQDLRHPFAGVSSRHFLGTDDLGRDVFSRLIYGAQVSMRASFEVVGIALAFAIPIGLLAGFRGGAVDYVLMRLADAGLSFPPLVLALAVVAVLGPGINNAALALAVVFMPGFARLIRGQALAVKEETFIEASRAIGTRPVVIVARRLFPNTVSVIIIQASLALGAVLLAEASLSFLGLGAQPPTPSWGSMLHEAYDTGLFAHPWSLVVPGATIALTVLAFNTIGDGLSAALGVDRQRRGWRAMRRTGPKERRGLTAVDPSLFPERHRRFRGAPETSPITSEGSIFGARQLTKQVELTPMSGKPAPDNARPSPFLVVQDLTVRVTTASGELPVVENVCLEMSEGETLGLVGESGSGKSVTSLAILRLLSSPPFRIVSGQVKLGGRDLLQMNLKGMRQIRGGEVAMIFQDPMTSLNPAQSVGYQLAEAVRLHSDGSRDDANRRAVDLLHQVGIPDPSSRVHSYPHQLSGGMRQRVMIAMALAGRPRLLIADEPTTALDVTVQAQILDLLRELSRREGLGVLLVTHDLGVVAEVCDRIAVMYAGQIVETGRTSDVFTSPRHPYTAGLIAASRSTPVGEDLEAIPGHVPSLGVTPSGCRFHPRCSYATELCATKAPELASATSVDGSGDGPAAHHTRCLHHEQLTLEGTA